MGALLCVLFVFGAAWTFTPLSEWAQPRAIVRDLHEFGRSPLAPVLIGAVYLFAGFIVFPHTVLCLATILALGPVAGFAYATGCSVFVALVFYGAGRWLGADTVRQLRLESIDRLNASLREAGALQVMMLRLLPIAPFTAVNVMAGAARVKVVPYTVGTTLGLLPLNIAFAAFGRQIRRSLSNPQLVDWAILGAMLVLAALVVLRTRMLVQD